MSIGYYGIETTTQNQSNLKKIGTTCTCPTYPWDSMGKFPTKWIDIYGSRTLLCWVPRSLELPERRNHFSALHTAVRRLQRAVVGYELMGDPHYMHLYAYITMYI